jgi:hypothetical protein
VFISIFMTGLLTILLKFIERTARWPRLLVHQFLAMVKPACENPKMGSCDVEQHTCEVTGITTHP